MAAIARHTVVPRAASPALAGRARRAGEAVRLPGSARAATRVTLGASRRGKAVVPAAGVELAQLAELDSETVTIAIAAVVGLAAGLGVPIFFVMQEERDKERLEEIRELNRATLKATGEQMSEEEIAELRPSRYLDRREFKDDD